jgi:hypothetical protein
MTVIGTSLQQGMDALSRVLGGPTFVWKGTTVSCIPAAVQDANSVVPGGFQADIQSRILVKVQDWSAADSSIVLVDDSPFTLDDAANPKPIVGRTLTYQGKLYRILSARTDASQAYFRVDLGSPRK